MLTTKIVSGLEKPFANDKIESYPALSRISLLKGERISLQVLCYRPHGDESFRSILCSIDLSGELSEYATVRRVASVPVTKPVHFPPDPDYICTTPGLYPDVLEPLNYSGGIVITPGTLHSLFIDLDIPEDCPTVGDTTLSVKVYSRRTLKREPFMESESSVQIELIDAALPKQSLLFTQWFHSDCLADYYEVEKWSDKHFAIIESFMKTAKKNGVNMIFTPLISPPLDNFYDTRDIQLAEITKTGEVYEFSWGRLERWINLCNRVGIEYFEIGHLFTQAGAAFATKVSGTVDGEYKRLFPKDTPSDAPEYTDFLRRMLTSFLDFMKKRGDDKRCYFHISDEPSESQLETYAKAKSSVADLLSGYPVMDALSDYGFYEKGILEKPIVILDRLKDFTDARVKGLWTYTSGSPGAGYSNRLLGMSLARNRSICLLLYKYDIEGFLHWGYNFYNNAGSGDHINPFLDTSGGNYWAAGDPFSVYPGPHGEPYESLRLVSFYEGLCDLRAMRLCESLYSRGEVISALESALGKEILQNTYLNTATEMHRIREIINEMIKKKV